ncbi:MAG: ferredoxin family protein [bacterium]
MAYVITEPCIGVKDSACVEVCPVDCIYSTEEDEMYYINPEECIECATCVPECPVEAIFHESEVPDEWSDYIDKNANYDFSNAVSEPDL